MTREDFSSLLETLWLEERRLNLTKGREYASDEDVLSNFKDSAQGLDLPPRIVWYIYFKKHIDAITYYCRTGQFLSEDIRSRILDARLYLALLYAMIEEEDVRCSCDEDKS